MLTNIFAGLIARVMAGIIAVLLLAIGILWCRTDALANQRDTARKALATSEAMHAVTRASLDTLEQEMADAVYRGELRQERLEDARAEIADQTDDLRRQAERIRIEGAEDACVTPSSVLEARGL